MGDGKRPLGRPRNIWEYNIKMVLYEIGCGLHSYGSGYRQVVGRCECGAESSGYIKCREILKKDS
jgi:hypothetical protein